ncbi:MAG: CAP domain-containing protein [Acidobacteria bacterium]|nr:CAP domain-containing protein [Acidobacteriota bacterium]
MAVLTLALSLTPTSAADPATALENEVLHQVNAERQSRGLPALRPDPQLTKLARQHSRNMAQRRFFSHDDPEHGDVAQRLKTANVKCTACAENIYRSSGTPDPARGAVRAWMKSPGHRANLLGRTYTRTGIGVDNRNAFLITQIFLGD